MKSLAIFIVSFVFLCAYAYENGTSTQETSTQETSTQETSTTPKVPPCPENEEYNQCICRPDTCFTLIVNLPCRPRCKSGCTCREGYLRLTPFNRCRPKETCPQFRN